MDSNFSINNYVVGLFAHHVILMNNKSSSWSVNSGVMCHICHDVNKFIHFTKLDVAEDITQGDRHSIEALGIGTVELNVSVSNKKQQRCRLYGTLYVLKLSHSLLNVPPATRSEKSFPFTE